MKRSIIAAALLLAGTSLFSQEQPAAQDTIRKDALKVFMESNDYIRKEITFVN